MHGMDGPRAGKNMRYPNRSPGTCRVRQDERPADCAGRNVRAGSATGSATCLAT